MGDSIMASSGLAPRSWDEAKAQASALAKARGFVPEAYYEKPANVLAALMTGAELGIGPMQALRSIHIVEGRPTLSADLMLGLAIRAGVRVEWLENSPTRAHARFTRPGFPDHEESFTIEEAKLAGLSFTTRSGGPGMWTKYPRAMLRARVVSAALRAWSPDVLGAGAYIAGEIDAEAVGETIEAGWSEVEMRHAESEPMQLPSEATQPEAQLVEAERPVQAVSAPVRLDETRDEAELRSWVAARWAAVHARYGADAGDRVLAHAERIGVDRESVLLWLAQAVPAESEEAAQ